MLVRKLDPESYVRAYNVDLQVLYPWEDTVAPPFGAVWAILKPGETTKSHSHQDCESFFVATGRGRMTLADDTFDVEPGTVTYHRPFDQHVLTNTGDEDLLFLSVYWEQKELWSDDRKGEAAGEAVEQPSARLRSGVTHALVASAPPTPNGDLHVGHLAGPYVAGDVHTRYLRLQGVEAHYGAGTDDNSVWVESLARTRGETPQETADHFAAEVAATLESAGIERTIDLHPNASEAHHELTRAMFKGLVDNGQLVEKEAPLPYCESCDAWRFESSIAGRCPHCESGAVGNNCEACGWYNDPGTLLDATCLECDGPISQRDCKRFFFDMSGWTDELAHYARETPMGPRTQAFLESVLEEGAPEICVSYPTDWGVKVPVEGYEDQRIWVWFEMAPRYLSYSHHLAETLDLNDGWQHYMKSPQGQLTLFFGFDNSFYYGLLVPALYMAYDPEIKPAAALVTNEFYRLDGSKFSTSRDHRIMGRALTGEAPLDAARFYLAWDAPEREETNFTMDGFRSVVRRELAEGVVEWLNDLAKRSTEGYGPTVPATGDWMPHHRRFSLRLQEILDQAAEAYEAETYSGQRAARLIASLAAEARRFGSGETHWRSVSSRGEENRTGVALELQAAKVLALISAPIMPALAARVWKALGYAGDRVPDGSWEATLDWVTPGNELAWLGEGDEWIPGLADYLG